MVEKPCGSFKPIGDDLQVLVDEHALRLTRQRVVYASVTDYVRQRCGVEAVKKSLAHCRCEQRDRA